MCPNEFREWYKIKIHETAFYKNWNIVSLSITHINETTNSIVMPFSHLRLKTSICEPLCIWTCVCPHMCLIHMLNINWKHKFTFKTWATKSNTKRNDERSNRITYIISCTRTGLADVHKYLNYQKLIIITVRQIS